MSEQERIFEICLKEDSKNPIEIIRTLMKEEFVPMHGPIHHILVGSALLTAYKNAGGNIDLPSCLKEMANRGSKVPGAVCGYWGSCGAAISSGMFLSIVLNSGPLAKEIWRLPNRMTSKSLYSISSYGGPRCCKRDSYLSIIEAVRFVKEELHVEMETDDFKCIHSHLNNQCLKDECPFYNKGE